MSAAKLTIYGTVWAQTKLTGCMYMSFFQVRWSSVHHFWLVGRRIELVYTISHSGVWFIRRSCFYFTKQLSKTMDSLKIWWFNLYKIRFDFAHPIWVYSDSSTTFLFFFCFFEIIMDNDIFFYNMSILAAISKGCQSVELCVKPQLRKTMGGSRLIQSVRPPKSHQIGASYVNNSL